MMPGESDAGRTFEFLMNAMEHAAHAKNPARAGYAAKRRAVLDYVRELEARAANTERAYQMRGDVLDWLNANAASELRLTRDERGVVVTRWERRYITYRATVAPDVSQAVRRFIDFDRETA